MALRAVIFDYGEVLSGPADERAHRRLLDISGLAQEVFETHYWQNRLDYDAALLNSRSYWETIARNAGVRFSREQIDRLTEEDARMWTNLNEPMVAWTEELKNAGFRLAILSNMGEDVLRRMRREFAWLDRFDQLTWSCELGIVKPDPAIYRHTLHELGVEPGEALFLDNLQPNIAGAEAVGIPALLFQTTEQLARDLGKRDFLPPLPRTALTEFPLPAPATS